METHAHEERNTGAAAGDGPDVTALILGMQAGDAAAREALVAIVHQELHRRAVGAAGKVPDSPTLEPTALVNEVWLRLQDRTSTWNSRDHFLAVAATAMRNLVIDHARRRRSRELHDEPGGAMEVLLSAYDEPDVDLLALHEALDELAQFDAQAARLVELRYFVGASAEEAAEAAGLSARTATRRHEFAKRWLRKRLGGDADE